MSTPSPELPKAIAVANYDPNIGRVLGDKYVVEQRLGAGAMGVVYRGKQMALGRVVALKFLRSEFVHEAQFTARFWREAKAASMLDHPNTVRVFDFGTEPDGLLYIVMEFVDGVDLATLLHVEGPLPARRIANILSQILSVLTAAHECGILHRDLKPENVLINPCRDDDGRVADRAKVCDFGIAKMMQEDESSPDGKESRHLTAGLVVGTPAFMSPEQARGERLDARSDIYAVGLVGYQMLCARLAFDDPSPFATALKQIHQQPVPPSAVVDGVDSAIESICLRAMQKDPAARYQSAREMRLALRATGHLGHGAADPAYARESDTQLGQPHGSVITTMAGARINSSITTLVTNPWKETPGSRHWQWRWASVGVALAAVAGALWLNHWARTIVAPGASTASPQPPVATLPKALPPNQLPVAVTSAVVSPSVGQLTTPAEVRAPRQVGTRTARAVRDSLTPERSNSTTLTTHNDDVTHGDAVQPPALVPSTAPSAVANSVANLDRVPDTHDVSVGQTASQVARLAAEEQQPRSVSTSLATYDLNVANVRLGNTTRAIGATSSAVSRALSGTEGQLTACYRAALPTLNRPLGGVATLHIETDGAGVITTVHLDGPLGSALDRCAASATRARRIANVDTGSARADVTLIFRER
ncbi:MAG TPA: protein kinase [Polyangiaceae bacterium]